MDVQSGDQNAAEPKPTIISPDEFAAARVEKARRQMMDHIEAVQPIANRFEKTIGDYINRKYPNGIQMFALVLCELLSRVIFAAANKLHVGKQTEGEAFIRNFYDGAKSDALNLWENNQT